jgi:hypothetical protein
MTLAQGIALALTEGNGETQPKTPARASAARQKFGQL